MAGGLNTCLRDDLSSVLEQWWFLIEIKMKNDINDCNDSCNKQDLLQLTEGPK